MAARLSFIFRTDVHVADKSPASWKGDYPAEIWSNLEQIGELAREHQAAAVLDGGDYFHVKAATRNSHGIVVRSAEIHGAYPCPTWTVEGNHDIAYNNLDTVDRQPIGVLFASGVFRLLREEVFEQDGLRVRVVGKPYDPHRTLEDLRSIKKQPGDDRLIAVVHQLAGKNPPDHVEDFFGEPVFRYPDLVYPDGPDVWCFGHWHRDQGIEFIDGRYFVNQGSVSRGALVRENLERVPKVAHILVEGSDLNVVSIPLNVLPSEQVFDLEKKERRDKETEIIDQFVRRLEEDVKADTEEDVETTLRNLDFAPEVREAAMAYLERVRLEK